MTMLLVPPALLCLMGLLALACGRRHALAEALGAGGAAFSGLLGLALTVRALLTGDMPSLSLPWNAAVGASFSVALDGLSAFFCLPIYLLTAVAAVFGAGYLRHWRGRKNLGASWLFYDLLAASMVLVVLARNGVLFLLSWEIMSLSSWFLVTFESEKEEARQAGLTYLAATQIGTMFLLVLFLLLGARGIDAVGATAAASGAVTTAASGAVTAAAPGAVAAALDFSRFSGIGGAAASAAFLLAVVGFGTKAGFIPLHVWLPEAHPAAPSHVSALMSGVMIKTGIYGIVRTLTFLAPPPVWWGWVLVGVGSASAVLGVLYALAQRDLKRVLAYSSVENVGLICLGLGVGVLGMGGRAPVVSLLGFGGALLHVLNHSLGKGLLFLGAGSLVHATGTRNLERMGGLLRRMPATGASFLVGCLALCGLPPCNGFLGELLLYLGAFTSVMSPDFSLAVPAAVAIIALAGAGGLAAACFTRAFGAAFLGEPRSALEAHEGGWRLVLPPLLLAACCAVLGFLAPVVIPAMIPLAAWAGRIPAAEAALLLEPASLIARGVTIAAAVLAAAAAFLLLLRVRLLSGRKVEESGTWDCGYVKPTARMQYTASSFGQPLVSMFSWALGTRTERAAVRDPFPVKAAFSSATPDAFMQRAYLPVFSAIARVLGRMKVVQHGRLQLYVLYIAATLLILLVWKLG